MIERSIHFGGGRARMDDSSDPAMLKPTVFPLLRNVDPYYNDLRKRLGRKRVFTTTCVPGDNGSIASSQSVGQITTTIPYDILSGGTRYSGILCSDGQYFWTVTQSGGSPSLSDALHHLGGTTDVDMGSGAAGTIWRGVNLKAFCYITSGDDVKPMMLVYSSGLHMVQAGIEKPAKGSATCTYDNSPTGNFSAANIVYFRWAFKNSTTGVVSNPSAVNSDPSGSGLTGGDNIGTVSGYVSAGNSNINLTTITESTQAGVDKLVIYRTRAMEVATEDIEFWWDGEVTIDGSSTTTWDQVASGLADSALTTSMFTDIDNMRTERDVPPVAQLVACHGMRMFWAGAGDDTNTSPYTAVGANLILFSSQEELEYVAYTDQEQQWHDGTYLPTNGDVMALVGVAGDLLVLSKDCAFRMMQMTPKFSVSLIGTSAGCIGNDFATSGDGVAFWGSREGAYAWTPQGLLPLTHQILDVQYATYTGAELAAGIAVYYPTKKQCWFFVGDEVLVYQIAGAESGWVVYDGYKVNAACMARTVFEDTTTPYLFVVDNQNILYQADAGTNDGADTIAGDLTSNTRTGTVTGSGNTTLTDSAATFPTAGAGLDGTPVWVRDSAGSNAQLRWVTANTGTQLTVNTAWTTNPTTTYTYALGGIGYRIQSAAVQEESGGFLEILGAKVQLHVDRSSYSGDDTLRCHLIRNGASDITSGDTRKNIKLGDTTELNWPQTGFGADDTRLAAKLQVELSNYDTDRAILLKSFSFTYEMPDRPVTVGSNA